MSIIFGILPSLPPLPPSFSSFFNLSCIYRSSKKTRFFHVYPKFTKLVKSDPHSSFLFYFFVPRTSYLPIFLSYYSSASSPLPPLSPNLKSSLLFFFPHSFRSWLYTFLLLFIQTHFSSSLSHLITILLPHAFTTRTLLHHTIPFHAISTHLYINVSM